MANQKVKDIETRLINKAVEKYIESVQKAIRTMCETINAGLHSESIPLSKREEMDTWVRRLFEVSWQLFPLNIRVNPMPEFLKEYIANDAIRNFLQEFEGMKETLDNIGQ